MLSKYASPVQLACYDNDAFIPEVWARESLELLYENMVVANLVHRDFEDEIRDYGDVVHTRKPAESEIMRRTDDTVASTLNQSTSSTDVPVVLNQWFNQTFTIKPGEMSKSFADLVNVYLAPRMKTMARGIDRVVLGRAANAFGSTPSKRAGKLTHLSGADAYGYCVELDQILNENKAPADGRSLLLAPSAKAQMLMCDKFVKANERGDGGTALAKAQLGTILGFDTYMCQNVNSVQVGADIEALSLTEPHAAEYAGALEIVVNGTAGEFVNVAGNDQPTYMTDATSGAVVLNEGLKYAVLDNAVVTRYKACAANATYAAGYSEAIVLKSHTANKGPKVGQLLAFGTGANRRTYTIIEAKVVTTTTTRVLLDRPLEVAVSENDAAFPGPYGSINLALHRNALALVTRPLAVAQGAGMMSAVMAADGLGVRIAMQDQINVGRVIAIDILAGVAVLDTDLCVPLLG